VPRSWATPWWPASGLDGVQRKLDLGPPINKNIFTMSQREKRRLKIGHLPANLSEALDELEKDPVVSGALGGHILENYLRAKRQEWADYISHVHPWEQERYLGEYYRRREVGARYTESLPAGHFEVIQPSKGALEHQPSEARPLSYRASRAR